MPASTVCLSFDFDALSVWFAYERTTPAMLARGEYGARVGVPRVLELLDRNGIRATFFVPGHTVESFPRETESILERGHEVAHHSYAHVSPVDQDEAAERADFERALAALERHGIRPEGFRCPSWEPTWRTPALVAEYGLAYDSSLMDDDRPYLLETERGELVELPVHWALDDWEQYAYLPRTAFKSSIESPRKVLELWTAELDAMRRYGGIFVLTCHPFLSGRPHRVEVLRRLIEHARAAGDVEFVSGREAARRARADDGLPRRRLEPVVVDEEIYREY